MEALLREMEEYGERHHVPILRAESRQAFCRILREVRPRRALEIGTAIGYSALHLAMLGAEDIRVLSMEMNEERARRAEEFIRRSPYGDRILVMKGDAADLLQEVQGPFDFVFMDGAKGQYVRHFHRILPLLSSRAVVVADNVLFRGYVCSGEKPPRRFKTIVKRLREYIALVGSTPGFTTEILEDGDGMAVSRRNGA